MIRRLTLLTVSLIAAFALLSCTDFLLAQNTFQPSRFSVTVEGPTVPGTQNVIFIPGLASGRRVYEREAKLLTPTYRVHRIQIAGFDGLAAGPNEKGDILPAIVEELHQYIQQNQIDRPAVIGHSLGGLLTLMLADAHPEDTSRILIIDSLPFFPLLMDENATVEKVKPQAVMMRQNYTNQSIQTFMDTQRQFAPVMSVSEEGQKAIVDMSYRSSRTVIAQALYEDMTTDLRPRLSSIHVPAALIYPYEASMGKQSEVDDLYHKAYAPMTKMQFVRFEFSRHFVMYDQPAAFHKVVTNFLSAQ